MFPHKKFAAGFICIGLVVFGMATTYPPEEEEPFTNLKVLPKNIGQEDMERIMYRFERDLGVTCVHCHAAGKDTVKLRMNFASDEKKEKRVAREMLKMTLKLNRKYFNIKIDPRITAKPAIWCGTCHQGFPYPSL
jgi:Photosynthetic reaction centre cytochrome C subunit